MTFEEKITNSFQNFNNIDKPDFVENKLNDYADFVELKCLLNGSNGISFGDIQDSFFGNKEYKSAESRDKDEKFLNNIFQIINQRITVFVEEYPFVMDEDGQLLIKETIDWKHLFYLNMLISSALYVFHDFQGEVTTEFEKFSLHVLENLLPETAQIKDFGKNTDYEGNAIAKIRALAEDIGLRVSEDDIAGISERNYQERGLDIVGWLNFKDISYNKIVYLAQCACGKKYESKAHDTRRFQNYLKFYRTKPQHVLFIPYSLINPINKKFHHSDLIEEDFLLMERKRIVSLFYKENLFNDSVGRQIIESCLNYTPQLV